MPPSPKPSLACLITCAIVALAPWPGGAAELVWAGVFELAASLLLIVLAWNPARLLRPVSRSERALGCALAVFLGVIVLQLVPLGSGLELLAPGVFELRAPNIPPESPAVSATLSLYPHATRLGLAALAAGAALGLATARLRSLTELKLVMGALVLSAALNGLLALSQTNEPRAVGSYVSPNHLAGLCALALPICLALALEPRRSGGRNPSLLWLAPASLLVTGVLASRSRSGAVALFAGVAVLMLILLPKASPQRRRPILLVTGVAAGTVLLAGIGQVVLRFDQLTGEGESFLRLDLWHTAWVVFTEAPLTGTGLRTFAQVSPARVPFPRLADTAHNDPLNLLSDCGLLGAAPALVALVAFVAVVRRGARRLPEGRRHTFLAGAAGGVAALLAASPFEFNLQIQANLWCFAAVGGLAINLPRLGRPAVPGPQWARRALATALVLGALVLGVAGLRLGMGDHLHRRAKDASGSERLELLRGAEAWSPWSSSHPTDIGEELARQGDVEGAGAAFARACAREPRSARAHLGLARALLLQEQGERADEELDLAADLAPHFPGYALHELRLRLWRYQQVGEADADAWGRVKATARRVVRMDPESLPQVLELLLPLRPALEDLLELVVDAQRDPNRGRRDLARELERRGRTVEAARVLAPLTRRADCPFEVVDWWARLELQSGNGDLAAAGWRRAASLAPPGQRGTVVARAWRALRRAGYSDAALTLLWDLTAMYPDQTALHHELGLALSAEKSWEAAAEALDRALKLGSPRSAIPLARAYLAIDRQASARDALRRALGLRPARKQEAAIRFELGRLLLAEGRRAVAIRELERAARLDPRNEAIKKALDEAR